MFRTLFRPRPAVLAGRALYAGAVAMARTPAFYTAMGVPDTREGRFELYTLHVALLVRRLKGRGAQAAETAQGLFDAYVDALDVALRETGVGDLSMGKKMKGLGKAFYGRLKALEEALEQLPDDRPLVALLARTVFGGDETRGARLAAYLTLAAEGLEAVVLETVLSGEAPWPTVTA